MDFSALIADLRTIASRYNGKDTDRNVSTAMYCEMFRKILQKAENGVSEYSDQIVILWMTLSQLCNTYQTLTPCPARDSLYEHIFLLCAKVVLNIKWQQLPEDDQGKVNFSQTIANTHQHLVNTGFKRFELLPHLMENPWTDPTLSKIMSGDDKDESSGSDTETEETEREKERKIKEKMDEISNYIKKEDPLILKLRVEMLILENCEDFASNLCNCLVKYSPFKDDLDVREMQFILLHKLNQMDKLQEECEQIVCHTGIKLINRLEQKESNQKLCVRLVQIFLVQDWINPDRTCCTKDLIKLWIRHQYMADRDRTKFLENVWSIAKISSKTEQIGVLVTGLQKECGTKLRQLYTDLCVYAINIDKGSCEKLMMNGDIEGVKEKQKSMAMTCEKLAHIVAMNNLKAAKISALTAFALNPTRSAMSLVEKMYLNKTLNQASERKKERNEKKHKDLRHTNDGEVNLATLYEVERLLNMLRPYYLNPDLSWEDLYPVCQKFMLEKGANDWKEMQKQQKEKIQKLQEEKVKEIKSLSIKDTSLEKKSSTVKEGSLQYYCDDTTQFQPYSSTKTPDGTLSTKSPWTPVQFGLQSKPGVRESTKLIPWTKLQNMSIQNNPLDMTKASGPEQIKHKINTEAVKKPKEKPTPNFDFAKLLEATKNMPQIQTFMKQQSLSSSSVSTAKIPTTKPSAPGNAHLPYVPGLTSYEVQQAMIQQKKNLNRSFSVDQVQSEKSVSSKVLHSQHRERTLSVDRQLSNQPSSSQLPGWSSKSPSDLTKTSHQPRIIPHRTQPQVKSPSTLSHVQQSFGGNQEPNSNMSQDNSGQIKNFLTPVVTQTLPARRSRQPSKEELQSIVDWLQTGTEDAKIKPSNLSQIIVSNDANAAVSKPKKSSTVQSGNHSQYVTVGSSPSQALQNTKKSQEQLKIKDEKSKNFASQVMTKVGIRPGMSQEEINIARIKEIMRQQQEAVMKEKQEKPTKKSPKTSSKGFLLIPGSAHTVMQAKMQGDRTKMLQDKMKGVQKPSKIKPFSPENNSISQGNLQSTVSVGQNYVNQMIQSASPQSIRSGVSQTAIVPSDTSKVAKFKEFDIQHALQSLSKVLDKSSNVLSQNPALLGKSKKEEMLQRPARPASAMPNLMAITTSVTTASYTKPVQNSVLERGMPSVQKQPSPELPVETSSYQLLYLGQIKTSKSKESSEQVSRTQTEQAIEVIPESVQNSQVNSTNVMKVGSQGVSLPNHQIVANAGTQNILSAMSENVSLQGVGASVLNPPSATLQTVNPQGLIMGTQLAQAGSVQGSVIQTLTPPSMTLCTPSALPIQAQAVQNIAVQGITAEYQPLPLNSIVQGPNNLNQGQNVLGQQTLIQGQSSFVQGLLQGQNTLIQGQNTVIQGHQTFVQGQNAMVQGQGINIQSIQTGQTFGIQGVANQNNVLPVVQGVNFQTPLDTGQPTFVQPNSQQFGLNPGTQLLGVNTLHVPNGTANLTIERMQPNTTVTFTNPTVVMSTEISASTTALALNNQNVIQNVNTTIIPQNTVPIATNAISFDSNNTVLGNTISPAFSLMQPVQPSQHPGNLLVQNSNTLNHNLSLTSHVTVMQPYTAQPISTSLSSPKPVKILPKTPVFVGPFKLIADSNSTTSTSQTDVQGCLVPTTSPTKMKPIPASSLSPLKTSQPCSVINTSQASSFDKLLLEHLVSAKASISEQEKQWQSELSDNGTEIVRRVELSELQKNTLTESENLNQECAIPAKSDEGHLSLSGHPSSNIDTNLEMLNSEGSSLQSIDKPAMDPLLTSAIPSISSGKDVNIVDIHITTCSKSDESTLESQKDETPAESAALNTNISEGTTLQKTSSEKHSNFLSDTTQGNFLKGLNQFKERLASAKFPSIETKGISESCSTVTDSEIMEVSSNDNVNEESSLFKHNVALHNTDQSHVTYCEHVGKKINDLLHQTNSEAIHKDQELDLPLHADTEKLDTLIIENEKISTQTRKNFNDENKTTDIIDSPLEIDSKIIDKVEELNQNQTLVSNDTEVVNHLQNAYSSSEVGMEPEDNLIESTNETLIRSAESFGHTMENRIHQLISLHVSKSVESDASLNQILDLKKDNVSSADSNDKGNELCSDKEVEKTNVEIIEKVELAEPCDDLNNIQTLKTDTVDKQSDILPQNSNSEIQNKEPLEAESSKLVLGLVDYSETSDSDAVIDSNIDTRRTVGIVDYPESSDSESSENGTDVLTKDSNLSEMHEACSKEDQHQDVINNCLPSVNSSVDSTVPESKTIIEEPSQDEKLSEKSQLEYLPEVINPTTPDEPASSIEETGIDNSYNSDSIPVAGRGKNNVSGNLASEDEIETPSDTVTEPEVNDKHATLYVHTEINEDSENKLSDPEKPDNFGTDDGNLVYTNNSSNEGKTVLSDHMDNDSKIQKCSNDIVNEESLKSSVVDEVIIGTRADIGKSICETHVNEEDEEKRNNEKDQNASGDNLETVKSSCLPSDASENKLSTPPKNDLVANYKMLMEEMLSLSATKKGTEAHASVEDQFTVRKSFGFDDLEKTVEGRKNGMRESSVPGFSIFADDLNKLPESCSVNKLQTRSLPDDWTPSEYQVLERSLSNEERKLRRSNSDINIANIDNNSNDFDTHSVISDREYQEKSLNAMQKGFPGGFDIRQLQYDGKSSNYRMTLPALKISKRKPQTETHLLTYGEWKNKDSKVDVVSNRKSPIVMNLEQKEQHEEPKVIFPVKVKEKVKEKEGPPKCKICLRTFDTIKALQQHVIHPCRPDIRKTVMQFKELDYRTVYTCNSCKVSCETEFAAKLHCDNCTGITGKRSQGYSINTFFRCKMCGEIMNYQVTALEHVKEKCLTVKQLEKIEKGKNDRSNSSKEGTVYDNENESKRTVIKNNEVDVDEAELQKTQDKREDAGSKSEPQSTQDKNEDIDVKLESKRALERDKVKVDVYSKSKTLQDKSKEIDVEKTKEVHEVTEKNRADSINNLKEGITSEYKFESTQGNKEAKDLEKSREVQEVFLEDKVEQNQCEKVSEKNEVNQELDETSCDKQENDTLEDEKEKDIDNDSIKSFSTEASTATIDASETSSIKSGDSKPRVLKQKQSARIISKNIKKMGKRVIKAKQYFGEFEVSEFVEKQAKKMNLKRKFKSGKSLSPKLRKSLNKKLTDVRKNIKANPKWHDDEKSLQDSCQSKMNSKAKRNVTIERVKTLQAVNFTNKNNTDLMNSFIYNKDGRNVYRCPIKVCRGPYTKPRSMMEHFDSRHKIKLYKRVGIRINCLHCTFFCNSLEKIFEHAASHLVNIVVDRPSDISSVVLLKVLSMAERKVGKMRLSDEMNTNKNTVSKSESTVCSDNTVLEKNFKSDIYENSKDNFSSKTDAKNNCVRRSARKKTDGFSVYKDYELPGIKVSSSGIGDKDKTDRIVGDKVDRDQSISKVTRSKRGGVNNDGVTFKSEESQNKGTTNSQGKDNKEKVEFKEERTDETVRGERPNVISNRGRKGRLNNIDNHDQSEEGAQEFNSTTCRRSRRKRHHSGESTASKASTFEDSKSDISELDAYNRHHRVRHVSHESNSSKASKDIKIESEVHHNHNTRKREHSMESTADKGVFQNKKTKPNNSSGSDCKDADSADKQTKLLNKRRRGSDLKLLEENKELLERQSRRQNSISQPKEDEQDGYSVMHVSSSSCSKNSKDLKSNKLKDDKHRRGPDYLLLQENKDLIDLKPRNRSTLNARTKGDCKTVSNQCKINSKKNDLEKPVENKQKTVDGGKESQNPFLESFKKFVGISKKPYSSTMKSLKQGKSSKLKSKAILHQKKRHLRKSKELKEERDTKEAVKLASHMVNVMDVVEIKDFRKNSSGNKKVEIIDLTSETGIRNGKEDTSMNSSKRTTSNSMNSSFLDSFLAHVNMNHQTSTKKCGSKSKSKKQKAGIKTQGSLKKKIGKQQIAMNTLKEKKAETSKNNFKRSLKHDSKTLVNSFDKKCADDKKGAGVKEKETSEPKKSLTSSKKADEKKLPGKNTVFKAHRPCNTTDRGKEKSFFNNSHSNDKYSDNGDAQNVKNQDVTVFCTGDKVVQKESRTFFDKKDLETSMDDMQKTTRVAGVDKGTGNTKSKGSDTAFQNCFMSYLGSEETTDDSQKDSKELNEKVLSRQKSPFKWDLDEEDADTKCKNEIPPSKDSSKKSSHDMVDITLEDSGSKSHKNSEKTDSQTENELLKSAASAFTNCLSSGENSVEGTVKIGQHVDFEKHFKEFISKSNEENDKGLSESQHINKKKYEHEKKNAKVGPSNSGARKELASETGEKVAKSVSSSLDNTQCRTKPTSKGFLSGSSLRNRIAKYNLPYSQSKQISSKQFVVKKTMESKKLIPISELNVLNSQESSGKNKPLLHDCTVKDLSNSDSKTSVLSQRKLPPRDQHRVRHMYHGGKVWQIGQGSVSSTNLASPCKNLSNTPCDDHDSGKGNESFKDGEKHSRWKARKSSPKRSTSGENELKEKKAKPS